MDTSEFIVLWSSEGGNSPVEDFLSSLSDKEKSKIIKKSLHFGKLTLDQLKEHDFLERIRGIEYVLYELKYKISPPFRAICVLWKEKVVVLKMFKGSGSNGRLGRQINNEMIEMAENWKTRFL